MLKCNHGYIEEDKRQASKALQQQIAAIVTGVPLGTLGAATEGDSGMLDDGAPMSYERYLESCNGVSNDE